MGACSHGKEGAFASHPSGNVAKCFCALLVTAKRSVDELFMLVVSLWGFAPSLPLGLHTWTPPGDIRPQTQNLPTPGENPAGVQE